MADNEILYTGCLVVVLKEVRVCGVHHEEETGCQSELQFHVCATAAVPVCGTAAMEERLGECVASKTYPLKSGMIMEQLAVPVMLLGTSHAQVAACEEKLGGADDSGGDETVQPLDDGSKNPDNIGKNCTVGLELLLDFNLFRGEVVSTTVRRRIAVESLCAISSQNCGVATVRVSADVLQAVSMWSQSEVSQHNPDMSNSNEGKEGEWYGLEFLVIVRSVDMSEPIRLMLKAEEEATTSLGLPQRETRTRYLHPPVSPMPYSALPLELLYRFYCLFYRHIFNKPMKVFNHVIKLLRAPYVKAWSDSVVRKDSIVGGRWNELRVADLRPLLLGEDGLVPVLATLFYCPSLRTLLLDQNGLSDISCYRIGSIFYKHYYLETLSICRNNVHEGGADQLVRLLRRNKRITCLKASDNYFTQSMSSRIQRMEERNKESILGDPFNVFSAAYAYAVTPGSFPSSIVKEALAVWVMLSSTPLNTVVPDCLPNSTFGIDVSPAEDNEDGTKRDDCDRVEGRAAEGMVRKRVTSIPDCALAPLLNEVMRTVALRVSPTLHDPWTRLIFSDIETQWKRSIAAEEGLGTPYEPVISQPRAQEEKGSVFGETVNGIASCDVEELYAVSFLHIVVVTMRAFGRLIGWEDAESILRDIGRRQAALGVVQENYSSAVRHFVQSLTVVCGKDESDVEHSAAFLQCLALGVRTAVAS
uniref:Uncharacterized protein n=1 Tax=Trypanosoma congolense (strain IL3000) TaxID=1068625 RepID=G0UVJ6_TRYCI|nr:conserved hypothetical protein [Trypanosoma congolense IL3000]